MRRLSGGGSEPLSEEERKASGAWLGNEARQGEDEAFVLDPSDKPGPPVVCKCFGFAFHEDQSVSKFGGCAENVVPCGSDFELEAALPNSMLPCQPTDASVTLDPDELKMRLEECLKNFKLMRELRAVKEQALVEANKALDANDEDDELFLAVYGLRSERTAVNAAIEAAREECSRIGSQIIAYRNAVRTKSEWPSDDMRKAVELTLLKAAAYKAMGLRYDVYEDAKVLYQSSATTSQSAWKFAPNIGSAEHILSSKAACLG
eukprot:3401270-Pleurochrysis_carterae.AAC.1